MIVFKKKFIRIAEAWGGEEPSAEGVDIVRYFQRTEPAAGALCREFYTIIIDLTREPGALFAAMRKGCQYKVRRAEARDNFVYESWDDAGRSRLVGLINRADRAVASHAQPRGFALRRRSLLPR